MPGILHWRRVWRPRHHAHALAIIILLLALTPLPILPATRASGLAPDDVASSRAPHHAVAEPAGGGTPARAQEPPFTPLGALALPGFNGDVWGHKGFAYIGSWGSGVNYPLRCPATGVRVIDVNDPRAPALVGAVAAIPGTSQEDVEVASVATPFFTGDLLVTGIQACVRQSSVQRGFDLWDVTNPRAPRHLAFWASSAPGGAQGVHELHLFQRDDRVYVSAAVPFSESLDGQGDFRLVDVTDPSRPTQISSWGAAADGGLRPRNGQVFYAHSAWVNRAGTLAAIAYWDAGAILLDISDPTRPTYLGRTPLPANADGKTHSAWFAAGEEVLLTTDEDLDPSNGGWGFLRLWDVRDPTAPVEIGRFATPHAATSQRPGPGDYSVHNPFVRGPTVYLSWYSDGVRVVDVSEPTAPRELASFQPPDAPDPFGQYPTIAMVWGVYVEGAIVLVSDINAGLYVLSTVPSPARCFPTTGQCVGGRFLDSWAERGGLAVNGYPISDERVETLEDGNRYTVQYFERTRLEYHPENRPPYDILLGQFGRRVHPADPPAARRPDADYFSQTGHNLGGRFRAYWRANGGVTQFGYPISEEFTETLEDGNQYTVQYFERARFERHPENQAPYDVLLGQFGRRVLPDR